MAPSTFGVPASKHHEASWETAPAGAALAAVYLSWLAAALFLQKLFM